MGKKPPPPKPEELIEKLDEKVKFNPDIPPAFIILIDCHILVLWGTFGYF